MGVDVAEAFDKIAVRLAPMDPTPINFCGRPSVVARTSAFRLRWFATRLHTFVVVSPFSGSPTVGELDHFLANAVRYAVEHKGGLPRGLQTGSAAVAVAITAGADAEASEWALRSHGHEFGGIAFPVLVDAGSQTVSFPQRMLLGRVYFGYLRRLVTEYIPTTDPVS